MQKTIQFSLTISELGQKKTFELHGILSYEFKKGLVFVTDYPLKRKDVLQLSGKEDGPTIGVVQGVAVCGTKYLVHVDFK